MNYNIRSYKHSDFEMIASWWNASKETGPLEGMMIEDGTYILEYNQVPMLSLTLLITQSKQLAYIEGYISNPKCPKDIRNKLGKVLWDYTFNLAKTLGYKRVICFTEKEKLINRYETLGMTKCLPNLMSMVKEL